MTRQSKNTSTSAPIGRNVAVATIATFLATTALLTTAAPVGTAAAISALPAVFAGPFVGGLYTLLRYLAAPQSVAKRSTAEAGAALTQTTQNAERHAGGAVRPTMLVGPRSAPR